MVYFIAFIILLGILVFVHELGHFLVAKWVGVRVEAFSIGFGKAIWKKQIGETEYRLAPIPLGGYVKLYGESYDDLDPVYEQFSFVAQKWYNKALIAFAGPFFNLILAILVFIFIFNIGNPELANRQGTVFPETPIYEANVKTGDEITSVNGKKIRTWRELKEELNKTNKTTVNLGIGGKNVNFSLIKFPEKNRYGELEFKNTVFGLSPLKTLPLLAIFKGSFFDSLGLESGDLVLSINAKDVKDIDSFNSLLEQNQNKTVLLKFLRNEKEYSVVFKVPEFKYTPCTYSDTIVDQYCSFMNKLGAYSAELYIDKILKDSPADTVLKDGDIIIAVNGHIVRSHYFLQFYLQESKQAELLIRRNKDFLTLVLDLKTTPIVNGTINTLGIQSYSAILAPEIVKIKLPFWKSINHGFLETMTWIKITVVGFAKLVLGKVSAKNLGGPMMIGKVAGESLSKGLAYFLKILAIISINLGLINLFPIPVLDGGMIVLAFYEGIMRRPMKEKHLAIIQQLGLAFLLFLVIFSLYNDIGRFMK